MGEQMSKQQYDAERAFASLGLGGQESYVEDIKSKATALWIAIDRVGESRPTTEEAHRLKALAKTALEESVMWAVKAVSRS